MDLSCAGWRIAIFCRDLEHLALPSEGENSSGWSTSAPVDVDWPDSPAGVTVPQSPEWPQRSWWNVLHLRVPWGRVAWTEVDLAASRTIQAKERAPSPSGNAPQRFALFAVRKPGSRLSTDAPLVERGTTLSNKPFRRPGTVPLPPRPPSFAGFGLGSEELSLASARLGSPSGGSTFRSEGVALGTEGVGLGSEGVGFRTEGVALGSEGHAFRSTFRAKSSAPGPRSLDAGVTQSSPIGYGSTCMGDTIHAHR